ncbi:APC family permease [Pseudonocardia broussonetiae]|uniref:Amino acid permease n=1 Tax=Pseudonocardia broussonetiae TaxID=2736640 RepID=A0A6M6JQY7_9PSEU|nr:APC family permease [Pseudonocardia broussonetiae]QJY48809.1 amino acid permease [Pseudonocardia broussonetiae]
MVSRTQDDAPLRRALDGRLLTLFVVGDVLGAGIYTLVGEAAGRAGGALWLALAVALGLALLTAASYAELVTRFPRAGGAAVFARRAFRSEAVAFLVGFCGIAAGVTSVGALAVAFGGEYLAALVALPPVPVAVGFLVVLALLNARGITESMRANIVMTLLESAGLVLIVVLGAVLVGRGQADPAQLSVVPGEGAGGVAAAVVAAAALTFYSFVGFETSANMVEETVDPRRTFPRALFGGLLLAGALYVLVGLTVTLTVPLDRLAGSTGPLLEVVRIADVGIPLWLFSVVALVAVTNTALLTGIFTSRLAYGMAEDGLLPPVLARVLPGRRTPWVAIVATTALALALALTGDLAELADTVVLLLLVSFLSTNVAVVVLRRRDDGEPDHFRVPLVVPVLGALSCVALMAQQSGAVWLRAALLLGLGVLLYGAERLRRRTAERTAAR